MSGQELGLLLAGAATLGVVHTLLGPDHYLPFLVLSRARSWTLRKTLLVTVGCGAGHVSGSIAVGAVGITAGWALGRLEWLEAARGDLAAWLLLGFGVAYAAWGLRAARRNRPHSHWHAHIDGTVHEHRHVHRNEHAHLHEAAAKGRRLTPWALFLVFILGPCEPLIPMLMAPASRGSWGGVGLVALVFGAATLLAMATVVALGYLGLARLSLGGLERWVHVVAGLTIVACGLAMRVGL